MADYSSIFIDGAWVPSAGTETIEVIDPATEKVIAAVPRGTASDVDAAVVAARRAFEGWWQTPVVERVRLLRAIAAGLTDRREELSSLITSEMGAPSWSAHAVQTAVPIVSFMTAADVLESFEFEQTQGTSIIVREPIGVVGAITPWNYPLHQIAAKVAYAIAAGNTVVVKPSEVAPLDAWLLAEVIESVGLPAGVFNLVSGTGPVVGQAISSHPDIDAVSFTGSTQAGKLIAKAAADNVKRVSLELGGKSPTVVLPDADLAALMPAAVFGSMLNSGQTCTALTRLLVPRERLAEAEQMAKTIAEAIVVGPPTAEGTKLGPLVSKSQLDRVRSYIDRGVEEGARLLTGGSEPLGDVGYYIRPTVFTDVTSKMTIHCEEIFGPVLSLVPYDSIDEAVEIANSTDYGLAAAVWSADPVLAREVARKIRAGQVSINGGAFNPKAPFGGYKQSGVGRELGIHGLEEFMEIKSLQM